MVIRPAIGAGVTTLAGDFVDGAAGASTIFPSGVRVVALGVATVVRHGAFVSTDFDAGFAAADSAESARSGGATFGVR